MGDGVMLQQQSDKQYHGNSWQENVMDKQANTYYQEIQEIVGFHLAIYLVYLYLHYAGNLLCEQVFLFAPFFDGFF